MTKTKVATAFVGAAMIFSVTSCGNATGNGALIGTGGGALLGAIVGKLAGNTAVGAAVGAGTGAIIGKHMDKVKAQAAAKLQNAKVEQVTDANGLPCVRIIFDSGILFGSGNATLSSSAETELTNFSQVLKANTDCSVAIQGYTDNDPWKGSTAQQSAQKNLNLSQQRADAVKAKLNTLGISNNQIKSSTGYGEANPVADNSTAAGKALNRRVEVFMYASEAMIKAAENGTLQ
ncbi:MAG: OmpA family protein [Prevotellaceae bacterium]|nr:OmpA family protein [Prevotellaceae bacterium]